MSDAGIGALLWVAIVLPAGCGSGTGDGAGDGGASSADGNADDQSADGASGPGDAAAMCGPCPGYSCMGTSINVSAGGDAAGTPVGSLTVTSTPPGFPLSCEKDGCGFSCIAPQPTGDGHYQLTFSAPGYVTQTIAFDLQSPPQVECGCCGCGCPASFSGSVTLQPNGAPTGCCATDFDANNCGACGRLCPDRFGPSDPGQCLNGKCEPGAAGCFGQAAGFASCDGYCTSIGQTCVQGSSVGECFSETWFAWANTASCNEAAVDSWGASGAGACTDPIPWSATVAEARCCCTE